MSTNNKMYPSSFSSGSALSNRSPDDYRFLRTITGQCSPTPDRIPTKCYIRCFNKKYFHLPLFVYGPLPSNTRSLVLECPPSRLSEALKINEKVWGNFYKILSLLKYKIFKIFFQKNLKQKVFSTCITVCSYNSYPHKIFEINLTY